MKIRTFWLVVVFATCLFSCSRQIGVTIDRIDKLDDVIATLKNLPVSRPIVRVVFDEFVPATDYLDAVTKLSQVALVMGELVDSEYVNLYSVDDYKKRAQEYLQVLGNYVTIWEIGNEVNGEWLGSQVVEKIQGAYDVFKGAGKIMSINFYYNKGCAEKGYEMFEWINANVPKEWYTGIPLVLFSYYEDDCNNVIHDATYWEGVFNNLGTIFPNALMGFGEIGTSIKANKKEYVQRYYSLKLNHPRFIGGYFWWYFWEDRSSVPDWIKAVW